MDRRLQLLDRLKSTKLNKLTVKQGDRNVKLNLRTDLADSRVEIGDKVLDMLETYIQKQQEETSSNIATSSLTDIDQQAVSNNMTSTISSNSSSSIFVPRVSTSSAVSFASSSVSEEKRPSAETTTSPSKRVRFSLPQSVPEKQVARVATADNEDVIESFKCRLCRLKFSQERALNEHVSRVHGGKSPAGSNSISNRLNSKNNASGDDSYEDDDRYSDTYMDEDEDETEEDMLASSNSDISSIGKAKRRLSRSSSVASGVAPPHVAIRVAKAAYYNSKSASSSSSHHQLQLKSDIFVSGGFRGNFFSQERLPLRSCKIKMKIMHPEDNTDSFLAYTNQAVRFESLDRDKTVVIQKSRSEEEVANDQLPASSHANKNASFFKSLLTYVPINSVIRLDDLILRHDLNEESKQIIRQIHQIILDGRQFGVSLHELKKRLDKSTTTMTPMSKVVDLLKILLDNFVCLAVGVCHRVYVAHEFKQHWVIQSCKDSKGRGFASDQPEETDVVAMEQDEEVEEQQQESSDVKRAKNFKPVCLIPRPWRYIDGLLNRPVLKRMLETIMIYLKTSPHSTLEQLSAHFCPVLQPVMTLELLEMLEQLGCVGKVTLRREVKCDLESDFTNTSCQLDPSNSDQLTGDETHAYYLRQNSVFTFKNVFPN